MISNKIWIYKKSVKKLLQVTQEHGWAVALLLLRSIKKKLLNTQNNHRTLHQPLVNDLESTVKEIEEWSHRPIISVILPATNHSNQDQINITVNSLANQIYPDWELYVVSDHILEPDILIKALTQANRGIIDRVRNLDDQNIFDINSVLELIDGAYFCLVSPGDSLSKDALYQVAKYIHTHPKTDVIYSDEEYLEFGNARIQSIFKPDWSPDYFYNYPYMRNLSVFRTALVKEIGGFHQEYGSAQGYDLILRLVEHTTQISHIFHCLYRRAQLPAVRDSSLALSIALSSQQKALEAMLNRSTYPGFVEATTVPEVFRVRRHLINSPLVSIVIPSAGKIIQTDDRSRCLLETCIESIQQKSHYRHFEIVVVDGYDIPEDVLSRLQPTIQLVRDNQLFNYSRRINLGVSKAQGDMIILLNDDTAVLSPDWIESMLELAQQDEIGAVGARLLFPDGTIQHTGVVILEDSLGYLSPTHVFYGYDDNHQGYGFSNITHYNYLAVTGACLMMRKQVFEALGGLPEDFPLNYNDVYLCLKAHKAGYRNVVTPYARLSHYGSASRPDRKVALEEKQHFSRIWGSYLAELGHDPYCNPNFGLSSANFGFKRENS